jgi:hypothetical protein
MTILVFLRGFIVVVAGSFYNLPKGAMAFAAKFANLRAILAASSYRKFDAALAVCERLSFLARYNQQA